jgi:hypothetical protein
MKNLLLATTLLTTLSFPSWGADIDRVQSLCQKRGTCVELASADLKPAVIMETLAPFAQQRNSDPFHQFTPQPQPTQQQAQVQQPNQQGQIVVPAPQVVVQPPPQGDSWVSWILTALAGLFTTIFGVRTTMDVRKPKLDVGSLIESPEFKTKFYQAIQQVIGSGIPGAAISQIPGAALAEPLIRRVANEIVERRLESLTGGVLAERGEPMTLVPANKLAGVLDGVGQLIAEVKRSRDGRTEAQT